MGGVGGGAGAELGVWEAAGPQAFQSVSGQRVKQEPAMAATREPVGAVCGEEEERQTHRSTGYEP